MSANAVMTFPFKKRIDTELLNDGRASLHLQKWDPNFLAELKRVKSWRLDQQEMVMKTIMSACLK